MVNKRIILAIFIILIFLVSCKAQGQSAFRKAKTPQKVEFRTGIDALVLNFLEPSFTRLYEGDEIRMLVEIQNKGAYPQPEERGSLRGRIWVGGFDPNILELSPEDGPNLDDRTLEGKSPINLEGGRSPILFIGNVFTLPSGTTSYKLPIVITATYIYKTATSPIVCVDPNPRSANIREKVCDIGKFGNIALSGGQGAPIVVSRVEEEVTSGSIIFRIEIQNSGKGLVINENDVVRDPNAGYDWRDLNLVEIEEISVGNQDILDCKPSVGEFVRLINNKGFIICRLRTTGINSVYTTPMNIKLRYGYSSSIRKEIDVVNDIGFG